MRDEWLWDRTGEPDPEVERLERVLGRLRSRRPAPELPEPAAPRPTGSPRSRRWLAAGLAAAALVAVAIGLALWLPSGGDALLVTRLAGSPRVGERALAGEGRLRQGERLVTDAASSARIAVGRIGVVDVGPGSTVGLVATGAGVHRLSLAVGAIDARIWAPPRRFFVETPSAVAVDLGCAYALEVAPDGAGTLRVRSGWVGFDRDGIESLIPAGAMCRTEPGTGPGTPYYEDAAPELVSALHRLDFEAAGPAVRRELLEAVAGAARPRDALTLWHLLARVTPSERAVVYEALARVVPPPADVTRSGVLGGDRRMLERWWDALGLGSSAWWDLWKLPDAPV